MQDDGYANNNSQPYPPQQWGGNATPDPYGQWQPMNDYQQFPPYDQQPYDQQSYNQQPYNQPPQNQPPMSNEQWAAMQAAQLGMSPRELMEWQAMQQAKVDLEKKRERKRRRTERRQNRSPFFRIVQIILIVAVLGGVGLAVYLSMQEPKAETAVVQEASLGTSYSGDALIVRNESVYDDEGVQNIEYIAEEGSLVQRGDVVCYVYSTGYSSDELEELQEYRDEIKDYQQSLLDEETATDQKMDRLNEQVVERGLEVRALVQGARGNMINQETVLQDAIDERQTYFRSKYSSDTSLSRLYDDEETQQKRIDSWIKQRAATVESIISFYTDGYEDALNASTYSEYTPAEVRSMYEGNIPEEEDATERGKTDIYRLVRAEEYVVLLLIDDSVWNPVEGSEYKLMLENFSTTTVDATVISYTRSGGELLVRLGVEDDVEPVLYMRTCQAELSEYVESLLVPKEAIYTQNDQKGVVRVESDDSLVFVPITIVSEESEGVYISPIQTDAITAGETVKLFY